MSIVTKTGDKGTTGLLYNRRVPKTHVRVEAYGAVDELDAALGLARAAADQGPVREQLFSIQKDLVIVMGELATLPEDIVRYTKDGHTLVSVAMTGRLESWIKEVEERLPTFQGWATPGASSLSAALHLARTICRRAERRVCALQESAQLPNAELIIYLNRLSDLLWLLAQKAEREEHERPRT